MKKDCPDPLVKIIVLYFSNPREKEFYGPLKQFITMELNMPCQAIIKTNKWGKSLSVAGKIMLQINAKIGCPLWCVPPGHTSCNNMRIAVAAISLAANKPEKGL